jgi:hypothetical protein
MLSVQSQINTVDCLRRTGKGLGRHLLSRRLPPCQLSDRCHVSLGYLLHFGEKIRSQRVCPRGIREKLIDHLGRARALSGHIRP